jgi:hypothetical protein
VLAVGLLSACGDNQAPDDALTAIKAPEITRIVPAKEALIGAHIPTLDPATMQEAEIRKALEAGPRCDFHYTTRGQPVLAIGLRPDGSTSGGVVKLNGSLIALSPASSPASSNGENGFSLAADPVRMTVTPDARVQVVERTNVRRREANATFEVGQSLRVGYRGYLDCSSERTTVSARKGSG